MFIFIQNLKTHGLTFSISIFDPATPYGHTRDSLPPTSSSHHFYLRPPASSPFIPPTAVLFAYYTSDRLRLQCSYLRPSSSSPFLPAIVISSISVHQGKYTDLSTPLTRFLNLLMFALFVKFFLKECEICRF